MEKSSGEWTRSIYACTIIGAMSTVAWLIDKLTDWLTDWFIWLNERFIHLLKCWIFFCCSKNRLSPLSVALIQNSQHLIFNNTLSKTERHISKKFISIILSKMAGLPSLQPYLPPSPPPPPPPHHHHSKNKSFLYKSLIFESGAINAIYNPLPKKLICPVFDLASSWGRFGPEIKKNNYRPRFGWLGPVRLCSLLIFLVGTWKGWLEGFSILARIEEVCVWGGGGQPSPVVAKGVTTSLALRRSNCVVMVPRLCNERGSILTGALVIYIGGGGRGLKGYYLVKRISGRGDLLTYGCNRTKYTAGIALEILPTGTLWTNLHSLTTQPVRTKWLSVMKSAMAPGGWRVPLSQEKFINFMRIQPVH